jgi:hypothetical protein
MKTRHTVTVAQASAKPEATAKFIMRTDGVTAKIAAA